MASGLVSKGANMFRNANFSLVCRRIFVPVSLILILSGCPGPSQRIQSAKHLSTSGVLYADTVNGLMSVTIDRIIDFDSTEALQIRKWADEKKLKQNIEKKNADLIKFLKELNSFRRYTQLLKAYFLNLQALADSPVRKDMGAAVERLSESIKSANKEIRKKKNIELSKETMDGFAALSGLVAKHIHAAKIRDALRRDAGIISEQLILHEKLVEDINDLLKGRFQEEEDEFLTEKVIGPYVDKQQEIGDQWKKDRKKWLTSQFTIESLKKAKEAAKQLRAVWEEILQGRSDLGSITLLLQDINEFVEVVDKINEAKESKGDSQ